MKNIPLKSNFLNSTVYIFSFLIHKNDFKKLKFPTNFFLKIIAGHLYLRKLKKNLKYWEGDFWENVMSIKILNPW